MFRLSPLDLGMNGEGVGRFIYSIQFKKGDWPSW